MHLALFCLLLTAEPPKLVALDPPRLLAAKAALAPDHPALGRLRREADKALALRPPSVMDKPVLPPSGDKHDYFSLAPYSWPDPAKPDGLPYINRDGEVNPESKVGTDSPALGQMCGAVTTLALAYWFTGEARYADRAVVFLNTWFLDDATRMKPNLNHAQMVRGRDTGRGTGIIDTTSLINVCDSLGLLDGAAAYTPAVRDGVVKWFADYLTWLRESKNGKNEAKATNNHGTWYLAQTAAFALLTGDRDLARKQVERGKALLASQIQPDGRQPLELRRTKSFMYSVFDLNAWFSLAMVGRQVDVDLYGYRTEDGRCLRAALDYLAPFLADPKKWTDKQIAEVKVPDDGLATLLRRGALVWGEPRYEGLLAPFAKELAPSRFQLTWPAAAR